MSHIVSIPYSNTLVFDAYHLHGSVHTYQFRREFLQWMYSNIGSTLNGDWYDRQPTPGRMPTADEAHIFTFATPGKAILFKLVWING